MMIDFMSDTQVRRINGKMKMAAEASSRSNPEPEPHVALGIAVLESAVNDYKTLVQRGYIRGSEVIEGSWQTHGMSVALAKDTIRFFLDGRWDRLAALVDFPLSGADVASRLGALS